MTEDNDLQSLQERNARVEADKAWETSWARRISIAVMTYIIAALYMNYAGFSHAMLGAFVPSGGYLLSTLSYRLLKTFGLIIFIKNRIKT